MITALSIGQLAIAIVLIAAIVALVFVALRKFGVAIPDWVVQVFWILVCTVVVILAIKFVMTLF